jgi:hypothetical protein
VNCIPIIRDLYEQAKEKNVFSGILFFDAISFFSYIIAGFRIPGFFFPGDMFILFGAVVGILFAVKNDTSSKGPLKISLFVGAVGSTLSVISMTLFEYILYMIFYGNNLNILIEIFILFFFPGIIIGSIIGGIIGFYYWYKQREPKESLVDDEFFEDLK